MGGCATKEMPRSHRSGADGVVRPAYPRFRRSDHPVCAASLLAVGASTPPLRGGEYSLLNHNFLISPQRPRKRSPQKYLDQMPFVFRRTLLVVDHIGRLSECFSGQGQIALDFGAGAGQQVFRSR